MVKYGNTSNYPVASSSDTANKTPEKKHSSLLVPKVLKVHFVHRCWWSDKSKKTN